MVRHRRLGEADLADDLRPKMKGRASVLQCVERQRRPGLDVGHVEEPPDRILLRWGGACAGQRTRLLHQVTSTRTISASSIAVTRKTRSFWMAAPSRAARWTPLTSTVPRAETR